MGIYSRWNYQQALAKAWDVVVENWYLGFTAFGGPPVHFKIFHEKFVTKLGWVDEQTYQELFAICQAFSGPGSTKMHYCLNLIHYGFLPAVFAFLVWSLPGALGMYGLSVGISNVGDSLPRAVYALLSGLNAAVVGIIALAAVQLAQKAIIDRLSRILVFLGATAGLMYNALWYFPLLMLLAGCASVVFDYRILHGPVKRLAQLRRRDTSASAVEEGTEQNDGRIEETETSNDSHITNSGVGLSKIPQAVLPASPVNGDIIPRRSPVSNLPVTSAEADNERASPRVVPEERKLDVSWQSGSIILSAFIIAFIVIMVIRGTLPHISLLYRLFANMFLAGTIIFGGGPVVIPLLREYVVVEGWVSPRDFLIGLAIIQAFPGPNFNFAVYLGSLTAIGGGYTSAWGALFGYLAIFVPGLVTVHGEMGLWSALRAKRWVKSGLRGVNAAAIGLIYTAVYRLWQIGFIDQGFEAGVSLGEDPWWVVVAVTSYVGGYWFGLNASMAIVLGSVMGLIRYGIVSR